MKKIKRLVSSFLVVIMLMTTMITAMPVVSIAASVSLFWPADSRKINSYYGNRTYVDNNGQTVSDFHSGIDISGSTGNNIYAAAAGTVVEAVNNHSSYGNYILLHHPELGIYTLYAHCSKLNVSVGQSVYVGQVIAYIGATGNVTGAHLHFETRSGKSFSYHYNPMSNSFYYTIDHTCDYKKFVYYWATHPHYNCYACTICGNVIEDRNSSNYISTCTDCNRPSKPVILNLNEQYEVGTTVTISWTETSNTTHYNLWIWVQTDENTWEAFEHTYDVKNSLKRTFPIGKYKLIIQAYNSNLFESDHSDWLRCESDLTYFEVINPHTHSYTSNQTKAPTCTVAGILTYTCSCGDSYTEEISALGHTPGTAIETKAPTCTEEGINTTYCSVCGEFLSEESIPMIDHNWSEWKVFTEETDTDPALLIRYCKTCNISETKKDIIAEGVCGENATWVLKNNGELYITGSGEMTDFSSDTVPWASYKKDIKSVVINSGINSIGRFAFYYLSNLEDVSIPDSVTNIGEYAFSACSSLTIVTIPDYVTQIGDYAFAGSDFYSPMKLKYVTIGNSVTSIGEDAFYWCESIESVTIGDSVTSIGNGAFYNCNSLTSVNIPNSVSSIGDSAFAGCDSLTSVVIPDSVTSIGKNAFSGRALISVTVDENNKFYSSDEYGVLYNKDKTLLIRYPAGNTRSTFSISDFVISIGDGAFSECDSLTSVIIGDSVTSIGFSAFFLCDSLTSVIIGDSVISIGEQSFYNCPSLVSVNIPNSVTSIGGAAFYNCDSLTSVNIPNSVTSIGGVAFYDCDSLTSVTFGNKVTSIGMRAFEGCTSLTSVTIPDSVTSIGDRAFYYYDYSDGTYYKLNITIRCYENSYAHNFAVDNGYEYEFICNHTFTDYISDNNATCTENGTKTAYCDKGCGATDIVILSGTALGHDWSEWVLTEATCTEDGSNCRSCNRCGEIESEVIPATNHNWSEWIQISAPTATTDGEQLRYCKTCKTSETETIPALGEEPTPDPDPEPEEPVDPNAPTVVSVNNYTITLDKIIDIKEIRFAIGHYSKGSDIKAAEKNVTLDASTVKKYTDNGIFTYDLPWMGEYTFWVRYNDGSQYFVYTNVDDITPYVESYGVKLTVKDYAENYKDMWLAEGTFNSYNEIKASTAFKYQASQNKLDLYAKTTHDFSYTMTNPGAYTVLIRYNDGTVDVIHTELTVDIPEFSVNGLQTTVQNIPDIKIIRTAYGHYESVGDIKKANGVRNFSNKNDIKNAEEYKIQYREAGEVTLIVEYNNGYKHFCYINIEPKSATMIQSKNTVMFDDLDGFVMIRYAKGTYTTSSQIKAAEGSKVVKPADLIGGYAIISGLEAGTYTFCVQFDDESYNYYIITVE